ncbi:MAG TPA: hypothetical protein VM925_21670 [Labilithrix sp.]|nr:hypothetical protein [Labilithrix sp.]
MMSIQRAFVATIPLAAALTLGGCATDPDPVSGSRGSTQQAVVVVDDDIVDDDVIVDKEVIDDDPYADPYLDDDYYGGVGYGRSTYWSRESGSACDDFGCVYW